MIKSSSAAVLAASWVRLGPHGSVQTSTLIKSSSAAVLAASWDWLGLHGFVQISTLIKSSSAAVLTASSDRLVPHGSVQVLTLIKSSSAAVLAASSDRLVPHGSMQVLTLIKSTADDDLIRVETCINPCGPNRFDEAVSIAADGDLIRVYSETCINRSCSKVEILLRRTDLFDPVCFLCASLSRISKAETVTRTLFQTDNFFQFSDKKVTCLRRTQIKVLGIPEKQRINLDIFVNFLKKKLLFLHFKAVFFFFLISFCSF